jgi:predicted TIM-barrel enzyme
MKMVALLTWFVEWKLPSATIAVGKYNKINSRGQIDIIYITESRKYNNTNYPSVVCSAPRNKGAVW